MGLLHDVAWLRGVHIECDGDMKLVATIREDNIRFRMCIPATVDDIPVDVRVAKAA